MKPVGAATGMGRACTGRHTTTGDSVKKAKKEKAKKNLLVTKEKVRDLRPVTNDQMNQVAGGLGCGSFSEPCTYTRGTGP